MKTVWIVEEHDFPSGEATICGAFDSKLKANTAIRDHGHPDMYPVDIDPYDIRELSLNDWVGETEDEETESSSRSEEGDE